MSTEDPTYNEACAEVYDEWFGSCEEAAVDLLAELAGAGRVLELGIGSAVLALPPAGLGAARAPPGGARDRPARYRSLAGHGRPLARQARRGGHSGHPGQLRRRGGAGRILPDLRGLQHLLRAADP